MKNPFRAVMDWYVNHLISKSNAKQELFLDLQRQAHRSGNRVMRYVIFEDMTNYRNSSYVLTYTVRVVDGRLERLPDSAKPDITVYTDIPTIYGLMNNRAVLYPNGRQEIISPFGVWDGVRLGRIVWDGETTALKDMYLFDRKVLPLIESELRLHR